MLALEDRAFAGHAASVHDFRVAARSLRAALRTLTRRPGAPFVEKTRRTLQGVTRALADVRDRDVGRSLLTKLPAGSPQESALRRRLLGLSDSDRRLALSRSPSRWPRRLDGLLIKLLEWKEPHLDTIIRRTRAEAWQQRRRALAILGSLGRRYDPARLHELRRRIRSLRYAIEVLAEVDSGARARVAQVKPLQSALGDAQDRIVLSQWLTLKAIPFRRADRGLSLALRQEAAHFRAQSIAAHAAFLKLKPRNVLDRLALHVDPSQEPPPPKRPVRPRRSNSG